MTNIKDIIVEKEIAFPILKVAGELGEKHGLKVFVVGGFVRDRFLNRKSIEVDLMVEGDGIKFSRLLADELDVKKLFLLRNLVPLKFYIRKWE